MALYTLLKIIYCKNGDIDLSHKMPNKKFH